jgi:hypothetical protein
MRASEARICAYCARMESKPCTNCGGTEFDEGFIDDVSSGRVRWLPGVLQMGMFGITNRKGPKRSILATRCTTCSRLDLYAGDWV